MRILAKLSRHWGRRILVVRSDGIGDFALFTDCLKRLVEHFLPDELHVAVPNHCAGLAETCPGVRRVISWDFNRFRRNPLYRLALVLKLSKNGYRLVINPQYTHEQYGDHLACSLSVGRTMGFSIVETAPVRIRLMRRYYTEIISPTPGVQCELKRGEDLLSALAIPLPEKGLRPRVFISEEDRAIAAQLLQQKPDTNTLVCLMPGCLHPIREWPWRRYLSVARTLRKEQSREFTFAVLGSNKDRCIAERLVRELGPHSHNLAGRTSIRVLAAIIEMCDLYIGVETGAAHIAVAVNTPAVVIMGGGHFGRFMPYPGRLRAVHHPLSCYHCNWNCVRKQPDCILGVLANDVSKAALEMLEDECA